MFVRIDRSKQVSTLLRVGGTLWEARRQGMRRCVATWERNALYAHVGSYVRDMEASLSTHMYAISHDVCV